MKEQEKFGEPLYMFNLIEDLYNYVHTTRDDIDKNTDFKRFLWSFSRLISYRYQMDLYFHPIAPQKKRYLDWLNSNHLHFMKPGSADDKTILRCPYAEADLKELDRVIKPILQESLSLVQQTIPTTPSLPISDSPVKQEIGSNIKPDEREQFITGTTAALILGISRNKVLEYSRMGCLTRHEVDFDKRGAYRRQEVLKFAMALSNNKDKPHDKIKSPFNYSGNSVGDLNRGSNI